MNFSSLVLYGSCARGDNNQGSDIDMLAIHNGNEYEMLFLGNLNVSAYPHELALEKARAGDLFMSHVVYEGRIVTDAFGYVRSVFDSFRYKESYSVEKKMASDLAWYLVLNSKRIEDYSLLNKRLAWCIRSMLIAEAAEIRLPIFSSRALAEFYGHDSIYKIIENKSSPKYNEGFVVDVKNILLDKGCSTPDFGFSAQEYFRLTNNKVAVSTLAGQVENFY